MANVAKTCFKLFQTRNGVIDIYVKKSNDNKTESLNGKNVNSLRIKLVEECVFVSLTMAIELELWFR